MSGEAQILVFSDFPSEGEIIEQALRELSASGVKTVDDEKTALEALSSEKPEIVFAHLRAGAVASTSFLNEVWTRKPQTTRFLLGDTSADADTLVRCALGPHQFIPGPINSEKLDLALNRADAIQRFVRNEEIRLVVSRMRTLPSRPALSIEVMRELRSSNASARAVGELISKDLAISTKLLQVANSAFYSADQKVSDPVEAVLLLGLESTAALVLSIETFAKLDKLKPLYFSMDRVWKHSQSVSELSRKLCQMMDCNAEVTAHACTAALLHDIGKLALAQNFEEDYARVLKESEEKRLPLYQVEKEVFGVSHAETGAYLLALWGLPLPIVEAVAYHHISADALTPEFAEASALRLANQLVNSPEKFEKIIGEYPRELGFGRRLEQFKALLGSRVRLPEKPQIQYAPAPARENHASTSGNSVGSESKETPARKEPSTKTAKRAILYGASAGLLVLLAVAAFFFWPRPVSPAKTKPNVKATHKPVTTEKQAAEKKVEPSANKEDESAVNAVVPEQSAPLIQAPFAMDELSLAEQPLSPEQAAEPEPAKAKNTPQPESGNGARGLVTLKLQAIMYAGDKSGLVINGVLLHQGESIEGWQVISIREHGITLQNGAEQRVLGMR